MLKDPVLHQIHVLVKKVLPLEKNVKQIYALEKIPPIQMSAIVTEFAPLQTLASVTTNSLEMNVNNQFVLEFQILRFNAMEMEIVPIQTCVIVNLDSLEKSVKL
jgi:hypothetical protein